MPDARPSTTVLLDALQFAAIKHRGQRRKDGDATPYINHLICVAHLLADVGGVTDLDPLVAAVLHDTVEDTDTTPAELEARFGEAVRRVGEGVTDDKSLEKEVRKQLQIDHAPHLSRQAMTVKLGDKIANVTEVTVSPPQGWSLARRAEYLDWTERVMAGCRGTNAPLEQRYDEVLRKGREALASV